MIKPIKKQPFKTPQKIAEKFPFGEYLRLRLHSWSRVEGVLFAKTGVDHLDDAVWPHGGLGHVDGSRVSHPQPP